MEAVIDLVVERIEDAVPTMSPVAPTESLDLFGAEAVALASVLSPRRMKLAAGLRG